MTTPSILIVNDDSIFSEGIKSLWEAMTYIGETTVVAPKSENSGVGQAITISRPLQCEEINLACGLSGFAVNGTPADSVKFAVQKRIRPIFMTTLSTSFGLLPLAIIPGAGAELYRGLAVIILSGLLISTFFTLFLTPMAIITVNRFFKIK